MRVLLRPAASMLVLAIAACAGDPSQYYTPPPGLTAATVVGSKNEKGLLQDDQRIILSSVDGGVTRLAPGDWDKPILVPPGRHVLGLLFFQGGLLGQIATPATLEAGKSYVVRAEHSRGNVATLWLEEQGAGTLVAEKLPTRLTMSGGGIVPVFLPLR
jgi:hypothetical protein